MDIKLSEIQSSVADPLKYFSDPDPAFELQADPDPGL